LRPNDCSEKYFPRPRLRSQTTTSYEAAFRENDIDATALSAPTLSQQKILEKELALTSRERTAAA
jgi:hypothetical protein